jgi:hypothetical protein
MSKPKRYTVVASMRAGHNLYVNGSRGVMRETGLDRPFCVASRRLAIKLASEDDAYETASRLNGVAANGHCHKDILFFYSCVFTERPKKRILK